MTDVTENKRELHTGKAQATEGNLPDQQSGKDWPAMMFVGAVLLNTLAIALSDAIWILVPLVLVQSCLFIGVQEALDLASERHFARSRLFNEFCGTSAGTLLGLNFVAYRQSALSLRANRDSFSRTLCGSGKCVVLRGILLLPWAHLRLVYQINRGDREFVKAMGLHNRRQRCRDTMVVGYCTLALFAFIDPYSFVLCYPLPLVAGLWLDALLAAQRIRLPKVFNWLMLGRGSPVRKTAYPEVPWYQRILQ